MIRVFVADDHVVVRRGLRQILEAEGMSVPVEGGTADEVLAGVEGRTADVLVLDLSLPGGNGLDLLKEVKRRRPELPVLILTVHSEDQYAVRALRAGASGYLTKDMAPEMLVQAIRKVYRGGRFVTPALAERLVLHLHDDPEKPPHESLSNREFEVLRSLASGRTVSEAAETMGLSVKTVSTYRTRILEKMNMKTNAELTHYAIRNGLVEDA
jgi:DNA-binding NarL/FixJ family response regulator